MRTIEESVRTDIPTLDSMVAVVWSNFCTPEHYSSSVYYALDITFNKLRLPVATTVLYSLKNQVDDFCYKKIRDNI